MHWHRHPRDCPAAVYFQILTGSQLDLRRTLQKLLLHSVVVLLPAVIRKWRHIIKNEPVLLGVELRRRFRIPGAPSGAIAINQLSKGSFIRGLLLRPGANKSQQRTEYRQRHIHQPAPSHGTFASTTARGSGHSVSPSNPRDKSLQVDVPNACRLTYSHRVDFARPLIQASYSGLLFTPDRSITMTSDGSVGGEESVRAHG